MSATIITDRRERTRENNKRFREQNPGYQSAWRAANRAKLNAMMRENYYLNRIERLAYASAWHKAKVRKWRAEAANWLSNPDHERFAWMFIWALLTTRAIKDRQRRRDRAKTTEGKLRSAAYASIKRMVSSGACKRRPSRTYIGCDRQTLRSHLEARFKPGMSWENYGRDGWHIDHIRPLASFDLRNDEEAKQALHYTNLQPLWAIENILKADKWSVAA